MFIFHKTEVLEVILRCLTGLIYDWLKSYDAKRKYFHIFFLRFCTKTDICIFFVYYVFVFFVITFVPIKIQTCSAPQNDCRNLSFVKDVYIVGDELAELLFFAFLQFGHNFCTKLDLDPLSISKWPFEPQFCERSW